LYFIIIYLAGFRIAFFGARSALLAIYMEIIDDKVDRQRSFIANQIWPRLEG